MLNIHTFGLTDKKSTIKVTRVYFLTFIGANQLANYESKSRIEFTFRICRSFRFVTRRLASDVKSILEAGIRESSFRGCRGRENSLI